MGIRHFLVKLRTVPTDSSKINLKDLPGSGRTDVLCRIVNASFWLSWNIRKNVELHTILGGPPQPPIYLRFEGRRLKKLSPDERSIACFIKKVLERFSEGKEVEASPGIFVSKCDIDDVISKLHKRGLTLYLLDESGVDVSEVHLKEDSVFILGDHLGFSERDLELIEKYNPIKISLGKLKYTTSHCIVIMNYLLDRMILEQKPRVKNL